MGALRDLTGLKFGRLTVIERAGSSKDYKAKWLCRCDCGSTCIVLGKYLFNGKTKSCGCFRKEVTQKRATVHGDTVNGKRSALHGVLHGMKSRCYNPNCSEYKNYGGRGIRVCEEWLNDYKAFREWALSNGFKAGLTIERVDVNGNYCPENCTWISLKDQQYNKTTSVKYEGLCENQWADRLRVTRSALNIYRRRHNVTLEQAVRFYICRDFI